SFITGYIGLYGEKSCLTVLILRAASVHPAAQQIALICAAAQSESFHGKKRPALHLYFHASNKSKNEK
ncbi:MAG: hypothetical protein KDI41_20535, partial [Pseudomonadales bacterium]|nr:hypothetical protein [Pseudomonadales bacterium]